jgi:hypothetical protein
VGKYLDKIRQHDRKQQADECPVKGLAALTPAIGPGDTITWSRAGQVQQGRVDFLHCDAAGTRWAIVTTGASWAVVNTKFVRVMTP